ncbi:MAG: glycosyltransferase family 4 protein [Acidimicrobiales bacterium]
MASLLVTNDFPPKVGGIQSYLWELWRRLPPGRASVLTTPHPGAADFDAAATLPITRTREPVLLPHPLLGPRIRRQARGDGASLVVLDPALPLGWVGPGLATASGAGGLASASGAGGRATASGAGGLASASGAGGLPYALVLHGAEVTVPAALPGLNRLLARVVRGASLLVCAGQYPAAQAARCVGGAAGLPPVVVVPPGVDVDRFRPLSEVERKEARRRLGLPDDVPLIVGVSRLVPRKGFDVLLQATARLADRVPGLVVALAGEGRDRGRLEREARRAGAPVRFLGRVPDADLPSLIGCADVFAMCCRDRWLGLEQEGFGIVFLEAAACGLPVLAGQSGGAPEAVVDGVTGLVCDRPGDAAAVAATLLPLLADPALGRRLGRAGRLRAERHLSYDQLAGQLDTALAAAEPS